MKHSVPMEWDWEKRPKRTEKGRSKDSKHKKSIYNMLSEFEDFDNDQGEMELSYETEQDTKPR